MAKPIYSGPDRTGICVCGHRWDQHHLGCVVQQAYVDETGEAYVPQECVHYGCNEMGGLDAEGNEHCFGYRDTGEGKDKCQVCHGEKGGEPGNENMVDGVIMCDYCHYEKLAEDEPIESFPKSPAP